MSQFSNHDQFADFAPLGDFEDEGVDLGADYWCPCTICRVNHVNAGQGFDTCADCLAGGVDLGEPFDHEAYGQWLAELDGDCPAPLPEAFGLCPDGLHPFGSCSCEPPF